MNRASLSVIYQSEIVGNIYINEVGHFCFEYEDGAWQTTMMNIEKTIALFTFCKQQLGSFTNRFWR